MPRLDPTFERWLIVAGWSAIVILWHSTIIALAEQIPHRTLPLVAAAARPASQ